MREFRSLVVRVARENPIWGYTRSQGAFGDLGHQVGRTTESRILTCEGIKPAPDRRSSWSAFIKATWCECPAADFFTTEVWTPRGLTTLHTLLVLDLATRRVHITEVADGFLKSHRVLIVDRDTKLPRRSRASHASGGVETIRTPPRSPNCNAYAERPHQGLGNRAIDRPAEPCSRSLRLVTGHELLGGLVRHDRTSA